MSNYKVEFTLKQHTPIIHFQSDQSGATLRATELKPKLDRFLIEKVFKKDKSQYEKYLIDKDKDALNYKVQIIAKNSNPLNNKFSIDLKKIKPNKKGEIVSNPFPSFFATMGEEWEAHKKYFVDYNENIQVIIKTFHTELINAIEKNINAFFAFHNFGTRQSKGFGSYYLHEQDRLYKPIQVVFKESNRFARKFKVTPTHRAMGANSDLRQIVSSHYVNYDNYFSLFEKIEIFYKTVRSGINEKNSDGDTVFYFKSLLFKYFKKEHPSFVWDKAAIKSKFKNDETLDGTYLLRDLLGLSTIQEYKSDNFTVRHPIKEKDNQSKYPANEVQRLKSPILFKPVKVGSHYEVFLTSEDVSPMIFDKEFMILQEKANGKTKKIVNNITLSTPSQNYFDIQNFLKFVCSFNEDKLIKHIKEYQEADDHDYVEHLNKEKSALVNIFREIGEQL